MHLCSISSYNLAKMMCQYLKYKTTRFLFQKGLFT
nr:MAG TPA: hypothetical protein [Bacteriophage sp.]DAU12043.1 MAG TPA: hypothetical protein [Caudoviricetes sp.]